MFIHLHTHSTASDGLASPTALVRHAHTLGFTGIALTDHNTVAGHATFLQATEDYGLQPILGVELPVRTPLGTGHMVILSRTEAEYHKLCWVVRRKSLWKKATWLGDLKGCGVVTSGCLGGVASQYLLRQDYWSARDTLELCRTTLEDNFYIEVQPTFGIVLSWLLSLSRTLAIPSIATNDVHYLESEEGVKHYGLHLATEEQMKGATPFTEFRHAIQNTNRIAESCTYPETSQTFQRAARADTAKAA